MNLFAQKLQQVWQSKRKALGLTQAKLSSISGLTQPRISQLLGKTKYPCTINSLATISRLLELELTEVVPELDAEFKHLQHLLNRGKYNEAILYFEVLRDAHKEERFYVKGSSNTQTTDK